jgi:hypothetical protein
LQRNVIVYVAVERPSGSGECRTEAAHEAKNGGRDSSLIAASVGRSNVTYRVRNE